MQGIVQGLFGQRFVIGAAEEAAHDSDDLDNMRSASSANFIVGVNMLSVTEMPKAMEMVGRLLRVSPLVVSGHNATLQMHFITSESAPIPIVNDADVLALYLIGLLVDTKLLHAKNCC